MSSRIKCNWMIRWFKIAGALLIVLLVFYGYRQWVRQSIRAEVNETRRLIRQQGFKTDLSDFDFTSTDQINERAALIIEAGQTVRSLRNAREVELMEWVGTNVAVAISCLETATNLWPLVEDELTARNRVLDDVCLSLLAGPVKFQPTTKPGGGIVVPYLVNYKTLAGTLALRAVVAMHTHDTNRVFTNVVAVSRLVTGWTPEPIEIAHMVRFACVGIAQRVMWELMQTDHCDEATLAALQREWESVRFFETLPGTAELSCASMVRMCEAKRNESYGAIIGGWGPVFRETFRSPITGFRGLWHVIKGHRQHAAYQNKGSYVEEKALLVYFRDGHDGLKRALKCSTWSDMRTIPGATNIVRFEGTQASGVGSIINLKQIAANFQGRSLMAGAAEAETQRRLVVTAIALKRFAIRHGAYPQSLSELVPDFASNVPPDFMDGKELRYEYRKDGRYLLYSVGLDCVDNGGTRWNIPHRSSNRAIRFLPVVGADLVWPLSATHADLTAFEAGQKQTENTGLTETIESER